MTLNNVNSKINNEKEEKIQHDYYTKKVLQTNITQ